MKNPQTKIEGVITEFDERFNTNADFSYSVNGNQAKEFIQEKLSQLLADRDREVVGWADRGYVGYVKDWERSLNIKVRFPWATEEQQNRILEEIKYQRGQGRLEALDDLKSFINKGKDNV